MRRLLPSCLLFLLFFHPGFASADTRTVEFPLTLEIPLVRSMVKDKIYTSPGERVLLEDPDWCATIELWDPQVFPVQTSLGIKSKIRFQSGFRIGSTCFRLVNWTGEIEIIQRLWLDKEDWQLKFKTEDSFIYDQNHKRPFLAGIFWDYAKGYLHSDHGPDENRPVLPGERTERSLASLFCRSAKTPSAILAEHPSTRRGDDPIGCGEVTTDDGSRYISSR